jgi:hypothetical protein
MIFKARSKHIKTETSTEYLERIKKWHTWYAILPVRICDNYYWFCNVERRYTGELSAEGDRIFEYRVTKRFNSI